jgi:serine/threonine-protein kinase
MSEADAAAADPDAKLIGTVIAERYRLDRLLGEGGMGKVYAAEHLLLRKRLAVKVLLKELCEMPEVVQRFQREAMATANINHANIAAATDCGKLPDGSLFLVLELVEGKSLRDEIAEGPMPLARALHIARQIASALAAAHALGIVHRDLKPENVMLVTQGTDPDFVKVLDFGIAKVPIGAPNSRSTGPVASAPITKAGVVFGTPAYMPPEQALGQLVDHRADLYALGVISYELLSGVRPFAAKSDAAILGQQLGKTVPPFAERAPGLPIPEQVEHVVRMLLARDAALRFQSAEEVVAAIDQLIAGKSGPPARQAALEGAPTAMLGTAEQLYGTPRAPAEAPPAAVEEASLPELSVEDLAPEPHPPTARAVNLEPPPPTARAGNIEPHPPTERAVNLEPPPTERAGDPVDAPAATAQPDRSPAARTYDRLSAGAVSSVAVVCETIDANRGRLPAWLRQRVRIVPAGVLLVIVVVPVWIASLLPLLLIATRSERSTTASAASASASAQSEAPDPVLEELATAKKAGHSALVSLAERHPKHARVQLALAASHSFLADYPASVAAVGRALAADAKIAEDPEASSVLSTAVRKRASSSAAFELLEGPMGAAGATVMYDLSIDQKVQAATRTRAQKWVVGSEEFRTKAPPPVLLAAQLRYGKSCADRHSLLPKAGEIGDQRALAYLKIMKYPKGCGRRGRDDCFPCMRKDQALQEAIDAIQKRVK